MNIIAARPAAKSVKFGRSHEVCNAARHLHEFRSSQAWEHKMSLLQQIHGEIATNLPETATKSSDAVEIDYLLD